MVSITQVEQLEGLRGDMDPPPRLSWRPSGKIHSPPETGWGWRWIHNLVVLWSLEATQSWFSDTCVLKQRNKSFTLRMNTSACYPNLNKQIILYLQEKSLNWVCQTCWLFFAWNVRSRTFARTATTSKRNGTNALLSRMHPTENETATPISWPMWTHAPHAWPGFRKTAVTHFHPFHHRREGCGPISSKCRSHGMQSSFAKKNVQLSNNSISRVLGQAARNFSA